MIFQGHEFYALHTYYTEAVKEKLKLAVKSR